MAMSTGCSDHDVLIVEDDFDIRHDLATILEDEGYRVVATENGWEALRHLRQSSQTAPCVILLDLMMPVMDGWQLRTELLKDPTLASIPVVVLSGAYDAKDTVPGAAAYLSKPFSMDALLAVVARLCRPQAKPV